ncbi:hypothetical protein ACJW30_05G215000 [Castanea mollissima]
MGWSLVKSLLWGLTVLVQLHRHRGCFEEERMGLLEIKEFVRSSPNVTNHHLLPSWVNDEPKSECCEWERVTCNPTTGHVTQLSLQNIRDLDIDCHYYIDFGHQNVAWFLNVSIFETFQELRSLNLSCNGIGSWIENEELLVFEDLEILDLSNNQLNGFLTVQEFKSLSKLSKLKHLDLGGNHFDKGILRSLGALSALTSLKLDSNEMEGLLYDQDLASLRSLEVLNLANNSFNGSLPKCLCGLKKLEELDLQGNSFEGTLPSCLYNLTSLQRLDLTWNQFRGNISSLIAGLTSLKYIDLSYNLFEGFSFSLFANHSKLELFKFRCGNKKVEIETENSDWVPLFQLESLVISNCSLNMLSHQFPTFLFHQHSLRSLGLEYTGLKGPFPDWLFRNNTRLKYAILNDNSFSGHFHLPLFLNSTHGIDVSNNQLIGKLQRNIGEILPDIKYLSLSNNSFTGSLPSSIGNMSLLSVFDVSFNNFSGEVPKEVPVGCTMLSILVLSNNNFEGHLDWVPLYNLTTLSFLKINHNQFSGAMPNELPNFMFISFLDVSNNKLSGKIPTWICNQTEFRGILMENNYFEGQIPCDPITVEILDFSHNLLHGSLPLWSSTQLKHLHLEGNIFSGSIPETFLNMSELLTLDISDNKLSGSIPSAISKTSNLRILLLGGNHLSGNISTQLCQLTNISLMDLSRNFFSGTIPHCFGHTQSFGFFNAENSGDFSLEFVNSFLDPNGINVYELDVEVNFVTKYRLSSYKGGILTYMSGLDLSCNNLIGEIPPELGQLQGIHALNLSHNQLTGSIPKSFSNLTELESLDLSHNRLSKEIPPQLIELTFLEVFSVAYNNLSGRTPDMKAQFGTFEASNYDGNPFLCGVPLEKSCSNNKDASPPTQTQSSNVSDEKWYKIDQAVFFTSFSPT